jgi:hypothetical protein
MVFSVGIQEVGPNLCDLGRDCGFRYPPEFLMYMRFPVRADSWNDHMQHSLIVVEKPSSHWQRQKCPSLVKFSEILKTFSVSTSPIAMTQVSLSASKVTAAAGKRQPPV